MNKLPQVAVVGSGYWGKNLVRNYHNLGALGLICDKNETVLENFQSQYPGVQTCLAYSDILSRNDIQGVAIATPAEAHYPLAREALLAGKHVYVEKPLVLEEAEGRELIDLAEQNNRVLMVGHLLQYHPVFIRLRELASSGELGRINYIYSNRLNLGKIRREENILWSFAPHDISMILSLAGEEPENIKATGGYYLHKKIADVTTTHMEFPSGLQAHIFVSWLHPFKEQKLVVVGDKKMAVFDDTQAWEDKLLLYPHEITWENNVPVPTRADAQQVEISKDEPLKAECMHFLHCMENGHTPITDGREGLRVLRVLNSAQECLDNGGQKTGEKNQLSAHTPQAAGTFVHDTAVIDDPAEIGSGTRIWHFSHVLKNSSIGENCNIGQNVVIGPDVAIGSTCKIQNNVSVYKGVTLEDGVFCGPSMVFTNIYNPRAEIRKMDQVRETLVKRGATLGANCTVICGVTIGRYAFIGAGAVVTRDVPNHALVAGNPARLVGYVSTCGEKLSEDFSCRHCGKEFERDKN
ncbi:MAG: Gfo/Idh/MocA family oxidoreductase, partial [Desulfobacteraceae bacterium]|nr:Gfo/Idh/MocA family oxidoreductase [Desulfobacteraceae bacterium]